MPPSAPLTKAQRRVLRFLQEFGSEHGFPPTHAEIAEALGFRSPNAAGAHLRLLAKKGAVAITPGVSRGLRILSPPAKPASPPAKPASRASPPAQPALIKQKTTSSPTATLPASPPAKPAFESPPAKPASRALPLIGHVAAGQPILAVENVEREVAVDPGFFRPRADYLLRVRGDSMIEAGILSGDLVAVHRTARLRDGQIAVVRLEDEVTVKRWRVAASPPGSSSLVVLEPANAALSPIVVDPRRTAVAVEGVVVGLLREGFSSPASARSRRDAP